MSSSHDEETFYFCHEIQLLLGIELTSSQRKRISHLLWNYEDRRCADYQSQLNECLRLDMPRRRGWVKK